MKADPVSRRGEDVSRNRAYAYTLVIMAVIVCVTGILILPQVDLPDFTMNSAQSYVTCVAHASASCLSAAPESHTALLDTQKTFAWVKVSSVRFGDATLPLISLSALRC
jgi:hypothetical protein